MNRFPISRRARATIGVALLSVLSSLAAPSEAAVGAKIILQGWEPWNDNRQPTTVPIDDPQFISGPLINAWNQVRTPLCEAIKTELGRPDRIRPGVSLYNISCQLNALDVRLEPVSQTRAKFIVQLNGSRITATSTTPNLSQIGADLPLIGGVGLSGGVDPRFSVSVNAQFEMDVEIGDAPSPLLTVRAARFNLMHADARGENISGKLAEWVASKVVPFFGGPDFERLAESRIDSVGFNVLGPIQQALNTVNARVAPYANYVRVGTWMSPTRIALALQPRALPKPQLTGEMRGTLTDGRTGQAANQNLWQGFGITAEYQVEPRRITNPDRLDDLAPPHMVPVGTFQVQPGANGTCTYAVRGLALGVTNTVHATHALAARSGGGSIIRVSTVLLHPGWNGSTVTPKPLEANRNFVLATDMQGAANVIQLDPRRQRIDPLISVLSRVQTPSQPNAARVAVTSAIDRQSLNPQPLPPKAILNVPSAVSLERARMGTSAGVLAIGATKALNPQPLPPKAPVAIPAPGSMQALNPQPLPPKLELNSSNLALRSGGASSLRTGALPVAPAFVPALH